MMLMVFGGKWDAPVCEDAEEVSTPLGQPCLHCHEPIVAGDRGFLRLTMTLRGAQLEPTHRECDLRGVVGSVGHLQGRCSCFGGNEEDPPGMTAREAAQAVWDHIVEGHDRG